VAQDKTVLGNVKSKKSDDSKKSDNLDTASLEGRILKDRYELEAHIGSGGMSDIYKAKDLLLTKAGVDDPYVAIKVLQQQYTKNKEAQQLLFREAHKTMALSHPNIIRVYDVDKEDGLCFIIMEWLDGETLDQVISRSKPKGLTYKGAEKIITQVASALKFAHQNGIVHTDLKPSNIMHTRNGTIKIFDFGVARIIQNNVDQFGIDNQELNSSLGGYTPAYASVELLQGQQPSESDDLFSLGCIFYELLSSKHPFQRKPADQAIKDKINVKKINKVSGKKWKMLRSALELSQKQRPVSVQQWQNKLNRKSFPIFSVLIPTLAIAGSVGYFYQMKNEISEKQLVHQQQTNAVNNLASSSVEVFMNSLEQLDLENPTIKAGILRQKRDEVIDYHTAKANRILQNPKARYPDFYQILDLLEQTSTLYPDSLKLADIKQYVEHQRASVRAVLLANIEQRLIQGDYAPGVDGVDIFTLKEDMKFVDADYVIIPSQKAINIYQKQLQTARINYDFVTINTLLAPGDLLFKDTVAEVADLLDDPAKKMAINTLTQYQRSDKMGEFPFSAAEVFYQDRFDNWLTSVKQVQNLPAIDRIYSQQKRDNKNLPDSFKPLIKLRRELGNRYLKLIVTGKIPSNPTVIKKAEGLFTKADEGLENQA
jgi:serine/threonine protein kinase